MYNTYSLTRSQFAKRIDTLKPETCSILEWCLLIHHCTLSHLLTFSKSSVQAAQFPWHDAVLSFKVSPRCGVVILQIGHWVKSHVAGRHTSNTSFWSHALHPFPLFAYVFSCSVCVLGCVLQNWEGNEDMTSHLRVFKSLSSEQNERLKESVGLPTRM